MLGFERPLKIAFIASTFVLSSIIRRSNVYTKCSINNPIEDQIINFNSQCSYKIKSDEIFRGANFKSYSLKELIARKYKMLTASMKCWNYTNNRENSLTDLEAFYIKLKEQGFKNSLLPQAGLRAVSHIYVSTIEIVFSSSQILILYKEYYQQLIIATYKSKFSPFNVNTRPQITSGSKTC